jgi:hypothetical protein
MENSMKRVRPVLMVPAWLCLGHSIIPSAAEPGKAGSITLSNPTCSDPGTKEVTGKANRRGYRRRQSNLLLPVGIRVSVGPAVRFKRDPKLA